MAITKITSHAVQTQNVNPRPPKRIWDIQERPPIQYKAPNREGWEASKGTPDTSAVVIDTGTRSCQFDRTAVSPPTDGDVGTSAVKAGWSFDKAPQLSITPILSRYRDRRWAKTYQFVGEDIYADQTAKSNLRQAFQGGGQVVSNWDVMEAVFDYAFIKLGVDSQEGGIDRPVILTEPIANLTFSRNCKSQSRIQSIEIRRADNIYWQ